MIIYPEKRLFMRFVFFTALARQADWEKKRFFLRISGAKPIT